MGFARGGSTPPVRTNQFSNLRLQFPIRLSDLPLGVPVSFVLKFRLANGPPSFSFIPDMSLY